MNTADTVGPLTPVSLTPDTAADQLLRITPLVDLAGLRIEVSSTAPLCPP
ncbi:hypothetical protein [Nonomuraea sp. NPDC049695]